MNGSRTSRALLVFAGLLLASGVMTALTAAESPPSPCDDRDTTSSLGPPPECQDVDSSSGKNGVDPITFWKLWSGDDDSAGGGGVDDDDSQYTRVKTYSAYGDFSFQTPIGAVQTWNSNDHGDFSAGGDNAFSRYPSGVSPSSGSVVKSAYVAIFSVDPQTVVHRGGSTDRYVAPSGDVRVVSDFWYQVPDDDTSGSVRHYYSHDSTVRNLTLLVDGTVVQQSSSKSPTFSFSGLSGSSTLKVKSNFTVRINHRKLECTDWNSTTDSCDGYWKETVDEVNEYTQIDSETRDVRVYTPPSVDARRIEYADSPEAGIAVEPGEEWARVALGEVNVTSGWEFYTTSPSGWGEMVRADDSGTSRSESSVQPLVLHAFPTNDSATVNVTDTDVADRNGLRVTNVTTETRQGAAGLSTNVEISAPSEYEGVTDLVATSRDASEIDVSDGRVVGLVAGQTRSVTVDGPTTIHPTEIEVLSTTTNDDGSYTYEFRVVDESGAPVTAGDLVVEGTSYSLSGGTTTVTVSNPGFSVEAEYEPPELTSGSDLYRESSLIMATNSEVPAPSYFLKFGAMVFAWLIPFALLGVAMDYFLGTTFFRDSIPSPLETFQAIWDAITGGERQ